jgi:hypothetical protein
MPLGFGFGELVVVLVILALPPLVLVPPAWRILTRAGFPGIFALLILVPLVNVVALFAFAFTEWPLERMARRANESYPLSRR